MPRSVISYYNWSGFYAGLNVGYGTGTSEWAPFTLDVKPKGMTYGATFGYNWQAGAWVYGVEGDYSVSSIKGSAACVVVLTCETSYVTAGGAYGNIQASINTVPGLETSESRFGYTFGAGLEYALFGNWTTKVEYLYVNLGTFNPAFTVPVVNSVSFDTSIIRAGLNYKF